MAKGRRIGKFPQNIVSNQRLPLRVVIDECLNMSLQEIGGNRHLKSSNATVSFENTVKNRFTSPCRPTRTIHNAKNIPYYRKINKLIYFSQLLIYRFYLMSLLYLLRVFGNFKQIFWYSVQVPVILSPNPVPLPRLFVVKNGSNKRD